MKKMLRILLAFMLLLVLSACSDRVKQVDPIDDSNSLKTEESEIVATDSHTEETEVEVTEVPESQQGIPPEYTLKRSVEPGWDAPLPLPEGEEFQQIFGMLGSFGEKTEVPDGASLFTTEEIETFFGLKVTEVEQNNQNVTVLKKVTYHFENKDNGDKRLVSIQTSILREGEDPNIYLYMLKAAPLDEKLGVEATMSESRGLVNLTILTEKNEIIIIQALNLDHQEGIVLDFAKQVYQKFLTGNNS